MLLISVGLTGHKRSLAEASDKSTVNFVFNPQTEDLR